MLLKQRENQSNEHVTKTGDCWMLLDVKEEKQHIAFVESVNCFKTEQLRKTETVEKVVLPNAEGNPSHESNE